MVRTVSLRGRLKTRQLVSVRHSMTSLWTQARLTKGCVVPRTCLVVPGQKMTQLLFERLDDVLGPSNSFKTRSGPHHPERPLGPLPLPPIHAADTDGGALSSASLTGLPPMASDSLSHSEPSSGGSLSGTPQLLPALPDLQSVLGPALGNSPGQSGDCTSKLMGPGDSQLALDESSAREQARGFLMTVLTQHTQTLLNTVHKLQEEQLNMQSQLTLFQQQAKALERGEDMPPK